MEKLLMNSRNTDNIIEKWKSKSNPLFYEDSWIKNIKHDPIKNEIY